MKPKSPAVTHSALFITLRKNHFLNPTQEREAMLHIEKNHKERKGVALINVVAALVVMGVLLGGGYTMIRGTYTNSTVAMLEQNVEAANRIARNVCYIEGIDHAKETFGTSLEEFCHALYDAIEIEELSEVNPFAFTILSTAHLSDISDCESMRYYLLEKYIQDITEKGETVSLSISMDNPAQLPQIVIEYEE